jgi:hypothetical protein
MDKVMEDKKEKAPQPPMPDIVAPILATLPSRNTLDLAGRGITLIEPGLDLADLGITLISGDGNTSAPAEEPDPVKQQKTPRDKQQRGGKNKGQ